MEKDTLIGAGVLTVVVIGLVSYVALKPAPVTAPVGPTATSTVALPATGYVEKAAYFTIDARYASSTPLSGTTNQAAVELMKKFVAETITQFKKDGHYDRLSPTDLSMRGFDKGRKDDLKIVYLEGSSANTISYIFTVYEDTGGAHGNTYFKTFAFDTTTGNQLLLGDLFAARTDYLTTLSKLAQARLPGVIGDRYDLNAIKDGTKPTEENFANFFIDNSDLVVLFPPYQVAAYSEGPQTLRLPLSLLKDILRSRYQ